MKAVSTDAAEKQLAEGALSILDSLPSDSAFADKEFMERQMRYNRSSYNEDPTWECLGRIFAITVLYEEGFGEKIDTERLK